MRHASSAVTPLVSGQQFKFHFQRVRMDTFTLWDRARKIDPRFSIGAASPDSGLENNKIVAGTDFSFPAGSFSDGLPHSMTLDKHSGVDVYTVIISPHVVSCPLLFGRAGNRRTAL